MFFNFNNFCIISNVVHTQFTSQSQATWYLSESDCSAGADAMFTQQKIDLEELFYTNFSFQFQDWLQGPEWIRRLDQAGHRSWACLRHDGCLGRVTRLSRRGSGGRQWGPGGCDHPRPRHGQVHALQCGPGGQGPGLDEHLLQPLGRSSGTESSPRDITTNTLWLWLWPCVCSNLANFDSSFIYPKTFLKSVIFELKLL